MFVIFFGQLVALRAECPPTPTTATLTQLSGSAFPSSLGSCALVGGSRNLENSGHGSRIEAHETVIRVNRLPHPRHFRDVGERTDVYFVNLLSKFRPEATLLEWEIGVEPQHELCMHASPSCNFTSGPRMVVFEGAPFDKWWRIGSGLPRPAPHGMNGVRAAKAAVAAFVRNQNRSVVVPNAESGHPVVRQSHALHFFEHNLPGVPYDFNQHVDAATNDMVHKWGYTSKPSGGLKAFLTFTNLCDSLTLFGFGGSSSADDSDLLSIDGHKEFGHNFRAEHRFYNRLIQLGSTGSSSHDDGAVTTSSSSEPPQEFFPTSFHAEAAFSSYFHHFARRTLCLARRRRIRIVT